MRKLLVVFAFALAIPSFASAQDDAAALAAQAAQQATMQAIQANQQAIQQMQQANQQAIDQMNQQTQQTVNSPQLLIGVAAPPRISVKGGAYSSPITVRLKSGTRGVVIYYTTDGWTPTTSSKRYTGPITINKTTTLQAIAAGPNLYRSLVSSAEYKFPAASKSAHKPPSVALQPSGKYLLARDSHIHLVFASDVTSKGLQVGDPLPLVLADEIAAGDTVVIPKGTPVNAVVTEADGSRAVGTPGTITFEVHSFNVNGVNIPLTGTATKEGQPKPPNAATLIPVVGPFMLFRHGTDAEIKKGTPFTAFVASDVLLPPYVTQAKLE